MRAAAGRMGAQYAELSLVAGYHRADLDWKLVYTTLSRDETVDTDGVASSSGLAFSCADILGNWSRDISDDEFSPGLTNVVKLEDG